MAICALALSATCISYLNLGMVPYVDLPFTVLAVCTVLAAGTIGSELTSRLVGWRVTWAFLTFAAWALAASLLSGRVSAAVYGGQTNLLGWLTIACATALLLAVSVYRSAVRRVLVAASPWAVLLVAFVAFVQAAIGEHPGSVFSNSTYMAMGMSVLIPASAVVGPQSTRFERYLRAAAALAGVAAVGVGGARVGFAVLLLWTGWMIWTDGLGLGMAPRIRKLLIGLAAALAVPTGAYAYRTGGVDLAEFVGDRSARFTAAWQGMLDRPLAGWGPDGFVVGASRHVTEAMLANHVAGYEFGDDPHNLVAYIAISTGLVGLGLAGWVGVEIVRNWRLQHAAGRMDDPFVWASVLFVIQLMFAPAAMEVLPLGLLALGLGLAVERPKTTGGKRAIQSTHKSVLAGRVFQAVAVIIAVVALTYGVTTLSVGGTVDAGEPEDSERAAEFWEDPAIWHWTSVRWGRLATARPGTGAEERDLAAIERATELEPGNYFYQLELARVLCVYGAPRAEVEEAFASAHSSGPNSPDVHATHAEYLLQQGDFEAAWAQLKPVENVESTEVWRVMALYYDATGDNARAAEYREMREDGQQ